MIPALPATLKIGNAVQEVGRAFNRIGAFLQGRYGQADTLLRKRAVINSSMSLPVCEQVSFAAPSRTLVGAVSVGSGSSIWNNVVLRGDRGKVIVGKNVHIMDGSVVTCGILSVRDVKINDNVVIEPNCTIEPCQIDEGAYVCAGAVLMEGCKVRPGAVIGPKAVVTQFQVCDGGKYYSGAPAKGRPLTAEEKQAYAAKFAAVSELAQKHAENLKQVTAVLTNEKKLAADAFDELADHGADDPKFRPHYFKGVRYNISPAGEVSLA